MSQPTPQWAPGAGDTAIREWHAQRGTLDPDNLPRLTVHEIFTAYRLGRLARELRIADTPTRPTRSPEHG